MGRLGACDAVTAALAATSFPGDGLVLFPQASKKKMTLVRATALADT
jgi:hypothetical protein